MSKAVRCERTLPGWHWVFTLPLSISLLIMLLVESDRSPPVPSDELAVVFRFPAYVPASCGGQSGVQPNLNASDRTRKTLRSDGWRCVTALPNAPLYLKRSGRRSH